MFWREPPYASLRSAYDSNYHLDFINSHTTHITDSGMLRPVSPLHIFCFYILILLYMIRLRGIPSHKQLHKPIINKGIGGDILDWLLGYESTRFKQFLKQHGEEKITSIDAVRKPIASAVRLGFDMITGGAFEAAHKKLGVDNFFHLFLVVNGKYRIEKNEVVNYVAYSKASDEEDMSVPIKGELTIDELIQRAAKGNEKAFWLEYDPLGNNCQAWVSTVLQRNNLMTPAISAFVKQDMERLLKELPDYTKSTAKDITDTASYVNRILQLTTGGRVGFAVGNENLRDFRQDDTRQKINRRLKTFSHV